jgi:hypothetical protein
MKSDETRYSDAVVAAVDKDRIVEAIKLLRAETGVGLREAKTEIDRLRRERQQQHGVPRMPGITTVEGGAGGLLKLIVIIAVLVAVYVFFF